MRENPFNGLILQSGSGVLFRGMHYTIIAGNPYGDYILNKAESTTDCLTVMAYAREDEITPLLSNNYYQVSEFNIGFLNYYRNRGKDEQH